MSMCRLECPLQCSLVHSLQVFEPSQIKTVVNDLQVKAAGGQGKAKAKEGKRSVQSGGDAPVSKKVKTDLP